MVVPTDAAPDSTDRYRLFIIYAKSGTDLSIVQIPSPVSTYDSCATETVPLFAQNTVMPDRRRHTDACVQATDSHIYIATDRSGFDISTELSK